MSAKEGKILPNYNVQRSCLTIETVINETGYKRSDKSIKSLCQKWQCTRTNFPEKIQNLIPITKWLPRYHFKDYILGDLISGFTVAVMHIPQGIAYAMLSGAPPQIGLYMAIFPALIYTIFGTSRQISCGTFAVISVMASKSVYAYSTLAENDDYQYTPTQVVAALSFIVGVLLFAMFLLNIGIVSSILSQPLINAFVFASAILVLSTQFKEFFGLNYKRHAGYFPLYYNLYSVFSNIHHTNIATLIMSSITLVLLIIVQEIVKPKVSKHCKYPIPMELIVVVTSTLIMRFTDFNKRYGINVIGHLPSGFPPVEMPVFSIIPLVIGNAIAIAIVSISIVLSLGLFYAKKHSYEIRPNQEFLALGLVNIVGSFFQCIPITCSLSRSLIQDETGGKTQLVTLFSASLLLCTLLWIAEFFADTPICALCAIIICALKGMLMQAQMLKVFAKQGKIEVLVWVITFTVTVVIDIPIGLYVGVAFSILAYYIKGFRSVGYLVGTSPNPQHVGIYINLDTHKNAIEIPSIKIFRYYGSINFSTWQSFRSCLYEAIDMTKWKKLLNHEASKKNANNETDAENLKLLSSFKTLILDLIAVTHMDVQGCIGLTEISKDLKKLQVNIIIAGISTKVYDTIVNSVALGYGPFEIYATLHDAVLVAKAEKPL